MQFYNGSSYSRRNAGLHNCSTRIDSANSFHFFCQLNQNAMCFSRPSTVRQLSFRTRALHEPNPHAESQQRERYQQNYTASEHQRRFSKADYDVLPHRIILLRHAESKGNVERNTYCTQADHTVPLTEKGWSQAREGGKKLHSMLEKYYGSSKAIRIFFMTSPYCRTMETTDGLLEAFTDGQVAGVRSAVQLREQDFGNFQDPDRISQDLSDRLKFGRFWFRFPNGESGADVYDRLTVFEDHLTRDMMLGRFSTCSVALITHGLTLRIFLMRWLHWNVDQFLEVWNPNNCDPIFLERLPWEDVQALQGDRYIHAKQCYNISPESVAKLQIQSDEMASYKTRRGGPGETKSPKARWAAMRRRYSPVDMSSSSEDSRIPEEADQALCMTGTSLIDGLTGGDGMSRLHKCALDSDQEFLMSADESEWWRYDCEREGACRMDDN